MGIGIPLASLKFPSGVKAKCSGLVRRWEFTPRLPPFLEVYFEETTFSLEGLDRVEGCHRHRHSPQQTLPPIQHILSNM